MSEGLIAWALMGGVVVLLILLYAFVYVYIARRSDA
jgi:hypothetical protein